jgi:hypothetical protein
MKKRMLEIIAGIIVGVAVAVIVAKLIGTDPPPPPTATTTTTSAQNVVSDYKLAEATVITGETEGAEITAYNDGKAIAEDCRATWKVNGTSVDRKSDPFSIPPGGIHSVVTSTTRFDTKGDYTAEAQIICADCSSEPKQLTLHARPPKPIHPPMFNPGK